MPAQELPVASSTCGTSDGYIQLNGDMSCPFASSAGPSGSLGHRSHPLSLPWRSIESLVGAARTHEKGARLRRRVSERGRATKRGDHFVWGQGTDHSEATHVCHVYLGQRASMQKLPTQDLSDAGRRPEASSLVKVQLAALVL